MKNRKEALNKQLHDLEESKDQSSDEIKRLGNGRNDIEQQEGQKKNEKRDLREKLKKKQSEHSFRVEHLEKIRTQCLGRFQVNITRLEKELDDYTRDSNVFTRRPIGPIGRYIKLNGQAVYDDKLAELLEIELGTGLLKSYICNCQKDRVALEKLAKQIWGHNTRQKLPIMYTRTFTDKKYSENDLSKYSVNVKGTDLDRVIDFLLFDEPNVFNLVVDERNIEQVSDQKLIIFGL